jgi:large subunit ribosomal protein L9
MKIILREDVSNLGKAGDVATVRDGYGRNFLLPQGKAVKADEKNLRQLEHQKRVIFQKQAKLKASAEAMAQKIGGLQVTFARKVGEQDKLYGSVTSHDLAGEVKKNGLDLPHTAFQLAEPLKTLGTFDVPVRLDAGVTGSLKVWVVAE